MLFRILAAAALFASSPAFAQPSLPSGAYIFTTTAQRDGRPLCTETWTFEGATLTVRSGEEIVVKRVRMETAGPYSVLAAEAIETNGAPDCMGQRTAAPAPGETRAVLVAMNAGDTLLCPAPVGPGPHVIGGCFGRLVPAGD